MLLRDFGIPGTRGSSARRYKAVVWESAWPYLQRLMVSTIVHCGSGNFCVLSPPGGGEICAQAQMVITDISMFAFLL